MFVNSADSFYYPEMGLTQETEHILKSNFWIHKEFLESIIKENKNK